MSSSSSSRSGILAKPIQTAPAYAGAVRAAALSSRSTMAGSAELAMVDVTTCEMTGGARQLYPPAGRATVVKYPHLETELPLVADGAGRYVANATVSTGLFDTVVSDDVNIADKNVEWRTYYDLVSELNAYDNNPRGYVSPGDKEKLEVPSQAGPGEVEMSFMAIGDDDEDAPYKAYAKLEGSNIQLPASWTSGGGQSTRIAVNLSRVTTIGEGLYVKLRGRTAAGLWEDVLDFANLSGSTVVEDSENQTAGTWEMFRMVVGWAALNSPLNIQRVRMTPQVSYFNPFVVNVGERTIAQWPLDFRTRIPEVADKMRMNALVAFVRIHGDADVAGVGQVAWSQGDDAVVAAQYPDLSITAREYFDMSRTHPAHAFWLPTDDDFGFKPLGSASDNRLRISVRVTDPNAIVRVVIRGALEFHTNNAYEVPMPYPARTLVAGERELLLIYLSRFPNIGCNPSHLRTLAAHIANFAKSHPAIAATSKDVVKTLSAKAITALVAAAATAI